MSLVSGLMIYLIRWWMVFSWCCRLVCVRRVKQVG